MAQGKSHYSYNFNLLLLVCYLTNFALCSECDNVTATLYYLPSVRLQEVENKRKFQTFSAALNVVAVTYERFQLYCDLRWKLLVFWRKTDCLRAVAA